MATIVLNLASMFLRAGWSSPFYCRKPDWNLLGLDGAKNLPAVRWRELNLDKSGEGACEELLRKLEDVIGS